MSFYLNLVFAWIAMITAGALTIIYLLRILNKGKKVKWVASINHVLRRKHKSLGVILIIFGLAHGIFSSDKAFGFNLGTISWITSILLGLSFVYRKRFNPQRLWMSLHRFLTVVFVSFIVIHILDVGGFVIDDVLRGEFASAGVSYAAKADAAPTATQTPYPAQSPQPATTIASGSTYETATTPSPEASPTLSPQPESKYIDGVYQGTAEGFRPGLTVEIEIKNDEIIRVEVISHNEVKRQYWGKPVEYIPQWIVEAQSTDVDTVSGATYTSRGIITAVEEALQKALR